jgi:uncharacterized protein YvpB
MCYFLEFMTKQIVAGILTAILLSVPAGAAMRNIGGQTHGEDAERTNRSAATATQTTAVPAVRMVTVSKAARAYGDGAVYIDIRTIFQNPELPTGCEVTALAMVLSFYGFAADKTDIARNYLPQSTYMTDSEGKVYINNFYNYFLGDPFGRGWGCFANAITATAAQYLSANESASGGRYKAANLSGAAPADLYERLKAGVPVIVWATIGMAEPVYNYTYYDILTGDRLDWFSMEHCYVLSGFDDNDGTVTLNDPLNGIVIIERDLFETRYLQMGSQAVVITEVRD